VAQAVLAPDPARIDRRNWAKTTLTRPTAGRWGPRDLMPQYPASSPAGEFPRPQYHRRSHRENSSDCSRAHP
jgi:hypothetical protein